MMLTLSGLAFVAFAANVMVGATTGAPFLGDVGEMLALFAASATFVAAVLQREAKASRGGDSRQGGKNEK